MNKRIFSLAIGALLATASLCAQTVNVTVTNTWMYQRKQLVEINASDIYNRVGKLFVVRNKFGREVPYQITYDGKILVEVAVRPFGKAELTIEKGKPALFKTWVHGGYHPERVDDIAWENDHCSYRLYGPALQRSKERAFGIDVWLKNTPELVNDSRYAKEDKVKKPVAALRAEGKLKEADSLEFANSYHFDHGYGLDCYKVGPTLGCGAPALMIGDSIVFPYCYKNYQILDKGPLRFTVKLVYNPATVGKDKKVVETRILSLDKGSNFNKMTVSYSGLGDTATMCAGVVLHSEDVKSVKIGSDFVSYADPTDNPQAQNFQIYVAALFPNGVDKTKEIMDEHPTNGNAGHLVGVRRCVNGEPYTYYFGSSWSNYDCMTFDEWNARVATTLSQLQRPLTVSIK